MPNDKQTLAQMVRAKFPGQYDDLDDATLEQKVLAKYPQYGDLPRSSQAQSQLTPATMSARTPSIWEKISDTEVPGTGVTFGEAGDSAHQWLNMAGTEAGALFGIPAAAAAPITAAATMGTGYLAGKGARAGAKAVGMGDTGQNLAEDIGNIAGGFGGNAITPEAAGNISARELLARSGRNGDNQVRPIVNGLSKLATGIAGHATGIPGGGAAIFSDIGPSLADALIPNREPIRTDPFASGTVAPTFPDSSEFYQNRADDLMRRGKEQAAIDRAQQAKQRASLLAGSPQQEAGYQPAVTKVPIRPMPASPLTPESVPGPDTSGKGNLLTPLAKTGDPRAAAELLRRGRRVLFVPDADTPDYISSEDFGDLIQRLQQQ